MAPSRKPSRMPRLTQALARQTPSSPLSAARTSPASRASRSCSNATRASPSGASAAAWRSMADWRAARSVMTARREGPEGGRRSRATQAVHRFRARRPSAHVRRRPTPPPRRRGGGSRARRRRVPSRRVSRRGSGRSRRAGSPGPASPPATRRTRSPRRRSSRHGTRIQSWCASAGPVNANVQPTCSRNSARNAASAAWPRDRLLRVRVDVDHLGRGAGVDERPALVGVVGVPGLGVAAERGVEVGAVGHRVRGGRSRERSATPTAVSTGPPPRRPCRPRSGRRRRRGRGRRRRA